MHFFPKQFYLHLLSFVVIPLPFSLLSVFLYPTFTCHSLHLPVVPPSPSPSCPLSSFGSLSSFSITSYPLPLFCCTRTLLPNVWSADQQQHHLEIHQKCIFSGPTPDLQHQMLWGWGSAICVSISPPGDLMHAQVGEWHSQRKIVIGGKKKKSIFECWSDKPSFLNT